MNRADLLALTTDALAALTNRGLVKRATREVDGGAGPAVGFDADGTVHGDYPDGVRVVLPAGGSLEVATCTCPATGACRHLVGLVLAYQRLPAPAAEEFTDWSPGGFTDEALEALVGARALAAARRTLRSGYTARVCRPTAGEPVPSVELAACTVRFLVPYELGYVHTDAAAGARDRVIPLAVWAFRAADEQAPGAGQVALDVGGGRVAGGSGSGLGPALALTEEILLDGVVHAGPTLAATIAHVRRDLDAAGLRWPLLALDDLDDQLGAYRARGASYRAEHVAHLIAELHARHRAVTAPTGSAATPAEPAADRAGSAATPAGDPGGGPADRPATPGTPVASPRSRVLGTEEAASTPLRRVRLVSLGCRVADGDADGGERVVDVYLAHPDSASVLVLRRGWKADGDQLPTGFDLGRKRTSGVRVSLLASGDVVSESAVRSASRMVRLATSGVARTSVTAFCDGWGELPEDLLVRDLAAECRRMAQLPPRLIRPRVAAEFVRVVQVGKVRSVGYLPGDQRLTAVIEDPLGECATISATYRSACPGALDALADALGGARGVPRYVSGALHRTQGGIVIDPLAVVVDADLVVMDLAPGDGSAGLAAATATHGDDPLGSAVDAALSLLAQAAHQGLRRLPETFRGRLAAAATELTRCGLSRAGAGVGDLAAALGPDPDGTVVTAWVDAQIRLSVTDECR